MKAAFATVKKQSISSALSALAEALGWQDEAGDLQELFSARPRVSSL